MFRSIRSATWFASRRALSGLGGYRSVYAVVSKFLKDPRLRIVFSFHPLLIGGNPLTASAIYTLIPYLERRWGVHFAIGGTGQVVRGLANLIKGQGGRIRTGAQVDQIIVTNGRARWRSADVRRDSSRRRSWCRTQTPRGPIANCCRPRPGVAGRTAKLSARVIRQGCSFGISAPTGATTTSRTTRSCLDRVTRNCCATSSPGRYLADDFSLYLHRPTATDPSVAPAGCDAFYVLSPVPNLGGKTNWLTAAEPYRQAIAARLASTILPDSGAARRHLEDDNAVGFPRAFLCWQGAAFGLEPVLTQSAWFRPHNRSEDIAGLYLVGAGTHPGAGVPGVLSSAKVLDRVVPHAAIL